MVEESSYEDFPEKFGVEIVNTETDFVCISMLRNKRLPLRLLYLS